MLSKQALSVLQHSHAVFSSASPCLVGRRGKQRPLGKAERQQQQCVPLPACLPACLSALTDQQLLLCADCPALPACLLACLPAVLAEQRLGGGILVSTKPKPTAGLWTLRDPTGVPLTQSPTQSARACPLHAECARAAGSAAHAVVLLCLAAACC